MWKATMDDGREYLMKEKHQQESDEEGKPEVGGCPCKCEMEMI